MAVEQLWTDYPDASNFEDGDILLAQRGAGGINVLASALYKKNSAGNFPALTAAGAFTTTTGVFHGQAAFPYMRLTPAGWGGVTAFYMEAGMNISSGGAGDYVNFNSQRAAGKFGYVINGGQKFEIGSANILASVPIDMASTGYLRTNATVGLIVKNAADTLSLLVVENAGATRPGVDNSYTLGTASFRWSTVYAATGTINTSDERDKDWLGDLTDAHIRAAARISAEIGIFQWKESVAEKGDDARLHVGVRAQRVVAIMVDEGLEDQPVEGQAPSFRHAFLCYDEWPDQTEPIMEGWRLSKVLGPDGRPEMVRARGDEDVGEWRDTGKTRVVRAAGNRYGLRLDQLGMFLAAAQAARLAQLEAGL